MAKKDGKKKKDAEPPERADAARRNGHELVEMPDVSGIVEVTTDPAPALAPPTPVIPTADSFVPGTVPTPASVTPTPPRPTPPRPTPPRPTPPRPTPPAPTVPEPALPARAVTPLPARGWSTDDLSGAVLVPLQVARSVLPTSRTPVALGVAALGLLGILDWPAALGIGLGWEALRRWGPEPSSGDAGRGR